MTRVAGNVTPNNTRRVVSYDREEVAHNLWCIPFRQEKGVECSHADLSVVTLPIVRATVNGRCRW